MKHGVTGYTDGRCRCDICRKAKLLSQEKHRYRRFKNGGPILIDAGPTAKQLFAIHATVGSWKRVDELLGFTGFHSWNIAHRTKVRPETAEKVHSVWWDYCSPVESDNRRWPSEPIYEGLIAKYGSLRASPWRRDATRVRAKGSVSTSTAETWADRLGLIPSELWPDWYTSPLGQAV